MKFTALILAGGKSRRMGSDKALVRYKGKPLISYSIDLALKFTDEIVICSANQDLISFGFPVREDILKIKAPLSGIHSGLVAAETEWNLVLTCDMPNVNEKLVTKLLDAINEEVSIVIPGHDGYLEPLCGFYKKSLIEKIEENYMTEKFSPLDLLAEGNHKIIEIPSDEDPSYLFRNINEQKDLNSD